MAYGEGGQRVCVLRPFVSGLVLLGARREQPIDGVGAPNVGLRVKGSSGGFEVIHSR